ncbi:MAG: nucleotidyltransferase family protein [Bdellovibrionales bacterium]
MGAVIKTAPKTAMLLAAGLGTRMRPLTEDTPKPMLTVAGRPMIDWALDKCVAAGVTRAVINLHHCGDVIERHLAGRKDIEIIFTHEPTLLDSGGGVKNALPHLGAEPFYCINADVVTTDGPQPMLQRLAALWDDAAMDLLMLMARKENTVGFEDSPGDYFMNLASGDFGAVYGRKNPPPRPYIFASTFIVHPRAYAPFSAPIFSNRDIFDAAEAAGRFYGLVHDGGVFHSSTPDDLARVNVLINKA